MTARNDRPRLQTVLREAIEAELGEVNTSIPATIIAYDPTSQKATVRPAVRPRRQDPDTGRLAPSTSPAPLLANVPVLFSSGNDRSNAVTYPLAAGDPVLLVFSQRSTDDYRATGQADNVAQSTRRFDLSDAVAIPGYRSFATAKQTGPLPSGAIDASALVVFGSAANPVKLGDNAAVDAVLKGTAFESDLLTYLNAMEVFVTALSTATTVPQVAAAAATFLPSVTSFKGTVSGGTHRSTKVKVS